MCIKCAICRSEMSDQFVSLLKKVLWTGRTLVTMAAERKLRMLFICRAFISSPSGEPVCASVCVCLCVCVCACVRVCVRACACA